jgi:hypothetical protein
MAYSTMTGLAIFSPSQPFSSLACFSVWTLSGEPSVVQIAAYFSADFFRPGVEDDAVEDQPPHGARNFHHARVGQEFLQVRPQRLAVGASGVPRLISRMPVRACVPWA